MTWWLKSRAPWAQIATLVATVCAGSLLGGAALPIPSLTGRSGTFLVGHLIPVLPAAVLLYGMGRTDTRLESVAARRARVLDANWAVLTAALATAAVALAYLLTDQDISVVIGRNIAGYVGLALLFAALLGPRRGSALTTIVPIALAAVGWRANGQPEPWAWPLLPATSTLGLVAAASLLALGVILKLTWPSLKRPSV